MTSSGSVESLGTGLKVGIGRRAFGRVRGRHFGRIPRVGDALDVVPEGRRGGPGVGRFEASVDVSLGFGLRVGCGLGRSRGRPVVESLKQERKLGKKEL